MYLLYVEQNHNYKPVTVKKLDFDPDPEKSVKSKSEPDFPWKSDPNPEIIRIRHPGLELPGSEIIWPQGPDTDPPLVHTRLKNMFLECTKK